MDLWDRVKFLGMIITNGGVQIDPDKIQAIREWKMPTTVPKIRSFLRFTGFYHQSIKGHSTIALPLTQAVRSTVVENQLRRILPRLNARSSTTGLNLLTLMWTRSND